MARNAWFQARAISSLEGLDFRREQVAIFAYSYAAEQIFEFARARGWRTILGQIDPGIFEEDLVEEEARRYPELAADWRRAPEAYWAGWRRELELADTIVVNSLWSASALRATGVSADRLKVIPLAYDPPANSSGFRRFYPERFDKNRPLRVLFLGLVNLRKGLGPLLDAARALSEAPVEFHVVGPNQLSWSPGATNCGNIVWHGSVPRKAVDCFYRDADVMLFPTLSDGFGITQLEARAWRLPLLVTPRCGAVIDDGVSGIVMEPGSARAIVSAIEWCIDNPSWLPHASAAVAPGERQSLEDVAVALSLIG
ncbi:glycosyltransferase family 4 protein [Limibaculum sp. M0105]|uniref:Glycosyltransferase family 4 protein n=1 Tax=Thermohalobaculum xanthum TaxID=2753746 RepID=A0A8J7SED5_9RHOB|nr:glycosyltransferase family 4 protein [Thermohalobaculum xanthum]MBK0399763.1 glycosyltransferase family 4 protein [Thermohalobaculum xanthum]